LTEASRLPALFQRLTAISGLDCAVFAHRRAGIVIEFCDTGQVTQRESVNDAP
jgi:hypothetical protein